MFTARNVYLAGTALLTASAAIDGGLEAAMITAGVCCMLCAFCAAVAAFAADF